ncbi:hypothetical protein CF111_16045 [Aeromonas sobria]|uniref:hypothetical protein n=1 Tax=Aeromonas sobria TaxID=646 RepID=UPI001119B2E8|nr:hypothetical protein [Aeromonas sobria]TNJ19614.1 hypothetical protein CF111_16045 [Aeromonas sobria]
MKIEEYLKQLGQQVCKALNETDEEVRVQHKYNILEQIECLVEVSKSRDHMILTTAAMIDNANKGEAGEYTDVMRKMVFDN